VLEALRRQGRSATADRVEGRLLEDIHAAITKEAPEGPCELARAPRAQLAGTLALAQLAGCDVRAELQAVAHETSFEGAAWHAAQVLTALGPDAPAGLFELCVHDLERAPWAPWTARAASALGDVRMRAICVRHLVISLNRLDVHGCTVEMPAPPIARVAATVEALAGEDSEEVLQALEAARAYLTRWQFRERPPPGLEPLLCCGAFPLSPDDWLLRTDVTAHAALRSRSLARRPANRLAAVSEQGNLCARLEHARAVLGISARAQDRLGCRLVVNSAHFDVDHAHHGGVELGNEVAGDRGLLVHSADTRIVRQK
jgi:hypothetical protein